MNRQPQKTADARPISVQQLYKLFHEHVVPFSPDGKRRLIFDYYADELKIVDTGWKPTRFIPDQ